MEHLVRLRADPSRIRVGIRRLGCFWRASVKSLGGDDPENEMEVTTIHHDPSAAVMEALECAWNKFKMDGVDLSMGWCYHHPQLPKVPPKRRGKKV